FPADEVPITSVTNGVHGPTWTARQMTELRERQPECTDQQLWRLRCRLRGILVEEVRRRLRNAWLQRGAWPLGLWWTGGAVDADGVAVGFAGRVATSKRLTLMLRDPERLRALLLDERRPIQFAVAGKSHPADEGGKPLMQQIVRFVDDPAVR